MNENAPIRKHVYTMRTSNQVMRALRNAHNWEFEAMGLGNSRYAPPSQAEWARHRRYVAMLERRLAALRAAQRNKPRRPERAARLVQKKFKELFYAPNNNGTGIRGRGYRMAMARTRGNNASQVGPREHTIEVLRAKLENLRHARDTGNRGNMVNIYNSMGNVWARGGGMKGANLMNNAQKIMWRARLI